MSNLLKDASILLTPTAYENGRMNATKPYKDLYGSELVINGDFSQGSQDWTFNTNGNNQWSVANEKASYLGTATDFIITNNVLTIGKKYLVSFDILDTNGSTIRLSVNSEAGGSFDNYTNGDGKYTTYLTANTNYLRIGASSSGASFSIDNVSVVEDLSGDFDFSRNSAATRVNAQGLVENVQILSSNLVQNGDFSEEGVQEVSNGSFSQEGVELVTNGNFDTDSDWNKGTGWTISGGLLNASSASSNCFQSSSFVLGKTYKLTYSISNYVSGSFRVTIGSTGFGQNRSSNGTFVEYIVYSGANFLYLRGSSSFTGSIDNVSVREVGQDWSLGSGWSIGEDKAVATDVNNAFLEQSNILTIGKSYKITYTILDYVSGSVRFRANLVNGTTNGGNGTYTDYIVSAGTKFALQGLSNFNGSITNISVKEVRQDWTFGTGWSVDQANSKAVATSAANGASIYQNAGLTIGNLYEITYEIKNFVSGEIVARCGNTFGTFNSSNGVYKEQLICTSGSNIVIRTGSNTTASVTNISVKEITDDTDLPRINYEGFSYQDSLGIEEVVNGDFATDSNWSTPSGWEIIDGKLKGTNLSGVSATQVRDIFSNKSFKVVYTVSDYVQGDIRISLGGVQITPIRSADGTYTEYIDIISGNSSVYIQGINNFTGSIDNVSVKEVIGQEVVPDSGCGSWLLEPQSTNLSTKSENISGWGFPTNVTTTQNYGTSPDGSVNSTRLQFTSNGFMNDALTLTSGTEYTLSIYAKRNDTGTQSFGFYVDGIPTVVGGITLTEEWQRFTYTYTASSSSSIGLAGDSGADVSVFGFQAEQQSYATSYIPTNGATNTRLQDIATNSGNSTLINSTEGVLYGEIAALANPSSTAFISLSDASGINKVAFYFALNSIKGEYVVNGGTQSSFTYTPNDITSFNKIAFSYKLNQFKMFANGSQVSVTDTFGSVNPSNTFNEISFDYGNSALKFEGKVKALAVYKEALTDEQLQSLTTI